MDKKGVLAGISAYVLWGLLPVYWKALKAIPALEIIGHRVVWSLVFLTLLITINRSWKPIREAVQDRKTLLIFVGAAGLLSINWITYVWGVNAGYIIETSLGYFINPLVSVLFGVIFFRERLRPGQWFAVCLAGLGVLYLTISYGQLPWIALTLATSFGIYGIVKKKARLGARHGLTLETGIMFSPMIGYLLWLEFTGRGSFAHISLSTNLLLVGTGIATAVPLVLFATAAQRIPLSTVGILQYIAPTMQFLIGVLVYSEPFNTTRMIGFAIIWAALLVYSIENLSFNRQKHIFAR